MSLIVCSALEEAANAFREAVIKSGALNYVKQDTYFDQLRALECALAKSTPPAVEDDVVERAVDEVCALLADWDSGSPEENAARIIAQLVRTNLLRSTPVQTDTAIEAGWRPIETAPKDVEIDVWVKDFSVTAGGVVSSRDIGRYTNVRWDTPVHHYFNPYKRVEGDKAGWVYLGDGLNLEELELGGYRATHWMPIPASPNQEKAQ